jgi:hypothetical protein
VGPELAPLSLVSKRKSSGSGLETENTALGDPSRWPRGTLYQQKLALSPPTSGDCSVGIVRSRNQAMEFVNKYLHSVNGSCNISRKIATDMPTLLTPTSGYIRITIVPVFKQPQFMLLCCGSQTMRYRGTIT